MNCGPAIQFYPLGFWRAAVVVFNCNSAGNAGLKGKRAMKIFARLPLVAAFFMLSSAHVWAQSHGPGVPGFLRSDGTFSPIIVHSPRTPSGTWYKGVLKTNLTIDLTSDVPNGAVVTCTLSAGVFGADSWEESGTVQASVSGSTATCTPTVDYSWLLNDAADDQIGLSFSISASTGSGEGRNSEDPTLATIPVPVTGHTTSYTLSMLRL